MMKCYCEKESGFYKNFVEGSERISKISSFRNLLSLIGMTKVNMKYLKTCKKKFGFCYMFLHKESKLQLELMHG